MKTTGLTIIEAIQSGLPFKRESEESYHANNERIKYVFTHTALLAQDWQIKLPEVTITREKLAEAWEVLRRNNASSGFFASHVDSPSFEFLCKALGL